MQTSVDPLHVKIWQRKNKHGQTMDVIKNKENVNWQGEHVELSNRQTKESTTCKTPVHELANRILTQNFDWLVNHYFYD